MPTRITALFFIALLLVGCGQTGPLFLPGQPAPAEPQAAPAEATPTAQPDSATGAEDAGELQ